MKSVIKYNALNGSVVTREDLLYLLQVAKDEEQLHIEKVITKLLSTYPDAQKFNWQNENQAIEILPNSMLDCLDCEEDSNNSTGLGKAVSPDEIYQMITNQIIEALDKPLDKWEMEWGSDQEGYLVAYNFITKKPYRSINQIILNPHLLAPVFPILKNPYFLTFSQIESLKGKVKKGSKAKQVTYYNFTFSYKNDDLKLDFKTSDEKKFIEWIKKNNVLQKLGLTDGYLYSFVNEHKFAFLKYYNVFNGSDIEGIDFKLDQFDLQGKVEKIENHHEKLPICEAIISAYPAKKPKFTFGGTSAHFNPVKDVINMPNLSQFKYVQAYYTTYFHEMIHSTGIESRLNRDLTGKMRGNAEERKLYYFEELIAELGAVFLCSQSGILHFTKRNSLAYLKSYRDGLVSIMKEDNKFIFKASTQSQKASDYLLQYVDFDNIVIPEKIEKPKQVKAVKKQPKKAVVKTIVKVTEEKPKVDKNGQIALFGAKKKKRSEKPLNGLVDSLIVSAATSLLGAEENKQDHPVKNNAPVGSLAHRLQNKKNVKSEYYIIPDKEISNFLGKIEKKPKESVAITIAGGQGSMKTRLCFQLMNTFGQNYKVAHASIEEHPDSTLYTDKAKHYCNEKALNNITAPEIESIGDVHKLVRENDVIIIDSFSKLQEMDKACQLDKDFRKAYDGKLFIIIYQLTSDGKMRGGTKSQFDGDCIAFIEKFDNYKENYVRWDKNRYQDQPELKFNIFSGKIIQENKPIPTESTKEVQPAKTHKFSFNVI